MTKRTDVVDKQSNSKTEVSHKEKMARCPGCGLEQNYWDNDGQGAQQGNESYCCSGCADGSECNCGPR